MATLNDNALTTLAAIEGELSSFTAGQTTADDDRITRYINVASDLFERETGRKWYYKEDHVERVPGYEDRRLIVTDHLPLESIASIKHDDDDESPYIVPTEDYRIDEAELGWIEHIEGLWDSTDPLRWDIEPHPTQQEMAWYEVTYTGGHVTPEQDNNDPSLDRTLPYDIEEAVIDFVSMKEAQRGRDPTVTSISMDRGSIEYAEVGGMQAPQSFKMAVRRYSDQEPY